MVTVTQAENAWSVRYIESRYSRSYLPHIYAPVEGLAWRGNAVSETMARHVLGVRAVCRQPMFMWVGGCSTPASGRTTALRAEEVSGVGHTGREAKSTGLDMPLIL